MIRSNLMHLLTRTCFGWAHFLQRLRQRRSRSFRRLPHLSALFRNPSLPRDHGGLAASGPLSKTHLACTGSGYLVLNAFHVSWCTVFAGHAHSLPVAEWPDGGARIWRIWRSGESNATFKLFFTCKAIKYIGISIRASREQSRRLREIASGRTTARNRARKNPTVTR
ncbi:hypothetical protein B0T19DRAFT_1230 [Cercophora scortea]|uniref:Uncharacterized protein n=1 Tax=Cercophora scortea TaxID=314031 RepID=A0AAE0ML67_9PEZI|nr:hypothetical protein B0T19DRAFT_1230 [Cercophora scortea]